MHSTETETYIPDTKVRRFRWWFVPLGLVFILVVSSLLVWWLQGSSLSRRYARIRAAGHPVTLEEMDEFYALPDGVEDNTELWLDAFFASDAATNHPDARTLPVVGDGPDIPPLDQPWAEKDAVVSFLNTHAEALKAVHRAADSGGGVRFPHDFSQGIAMLLPDIHQARSCARLLTLEAHVRAREGDTAGTVESIRDTFALARTLDRDPVLVSFLVRMALDGIAIENTRQLLGQADPTREELRAVQEDLRNLDYHAELENALIGERVFGLSIFDDPGQLGFGPFQSQLMRLAAPGAKIKYIDLMSDAIEAASEPWDEVLANEPWKKNWNPNSRNPFDGLVGSVFPAIDNCYLAAARQETKSTALDAAIAVELYQREHGEPPATLEALVPDYLPAVPIDPFSGKALSYKPIEGGFILYGLVLQR